jgi:Flp pilus assembly protein TadG
MTGIRSLRSASAAAPCRSTARLRGDDGAAVVEAALALPIVFWMLLGLFDFSMVELKQSQLTSAARDGARAGIISWQSADTGSYSGGSCPSTPTSYSTICTAVLQRLAGSKPSAITVTCYNENTTTTISCSSGTVNEGLDEIGVSVTYSYTPVSIVGRTFLGSTKTFTASARMVIQ